MTDVLYVNNTDPSDGGGGDLRIFEEAKILVEERFNVEIVASRTDPSLPSRRTENGVTIRTVKCVPDALHRFPRLHFYLARSLFPIVSLPYIVLFLWQRDIDLAIDSYTPHPSLLPIIARIFDIPVVALVHEYHDNTALKKYPLPIGVIQLIVQNFLRTGLYSSIIVPRELTKIQLREYGVDVPIHIIPNGIHYETYAERPDSIEVESYDLLVVSRLVNRKGLDLLLDAFRLVAEENPDVDLAIAGSGPQEKELKNLASEYDIESQVDYLGYVSEERKIALLHSCTLFVLPSRQEGFGIAILEAMATGKPVVVNNLDILRELIPESGGAFVDATNPEQFAEVILERLQKWSSDSGPGQINQSCAEEYSWETVGKDAAKIYREIASDSL